MTMGVCILWLQPFIAIKIYEIVRILFQRRRSFCADWPFSG